jgi:antibiotic biosynthesis monooxygenase (ABM) superfamily enzyme
MEAIFRVIAVWVCVFPLATAISIVVGYLTPSASVGMRSLVMTLVLVPLMVLVIGPRVSAWTQRALFNHSTRKTSS